MIHGYISLQNLLFLLVIVILNTLQTALNVPPCR